MSAPARLPRLLAALSLTIPLLSVAQTPAPALTDLERAQRDADKVLNFIKFQTVRTKPAETAEKPRKPAAPASAPAPAAAPRPAVAVRPPAPTSAEPAATTATAVTATTLPTATPVVLPQAEQPPASFGTPAAMPAPAAAGTEPEAEADDRDEVALQLQNFVAPVLSNSVQATLGGSTRKVTVRFTVEANGIVSKAEAAADVPRRFARPATDAVLQWRFAPLPQPRTVDVEIDFKRDSSG